MYFHNVVGSGSYITSTTNMYNKYQFHVHHTPTRHVVKIHVVDRQFRQHPGPQQRLGSRACEFHGFVAKFVRFDKRHFVGLGARGQVGLESGLNVISQ